MSGDLNMVNNKITNILNRTYNQDAATKNYVDNVYQMDLIYLLALMLKIHR